jgi:hypothetical protein
VLYGFENWLFHIKGRTQIEGITEQGAEENISVKRGEVTAE